MTSSALEACQDCGFWRPARAPACARCAAWIEADLELAWQATLADYGISPDDAAAERALAETIVADPRGVPWRAVDAAMLRVPCAACGSPLGSGDSGCELCRTAHDNRWLGAEPDRPGVPAGNEHWIRVSTAVARLPQWFPAHLVPMYAFGLPLAIAGQLPSNRDASELKRWLSAGGDVELLRRCRSHAEAYALIMAGRS